MNKLKNMIGILVISVTNCFSSDYFIDTTASSKTVVSKINSMHLDSNNCKSYKNDIPTSVQNFIFLQSYRAHIASCLAQQKDLDSLVFVCGGKYRNSIFKIIASELMRAMFEIAYDPKNPFVSSHYSPMNKWTQSNFNYMFLVYCIAYEINDGSDGSDAINKTSNYLLNEYNQYYDQIKKATNDIRFYNEKLCFLHFMKKMKTNLYNKIYCEDNVTVSNNTSNILQYSIENSKAVTKIFYEQNMISDVEYLSSRAFKDFQYFFNIQYSLIKELNMTRYQMAYMNFIRMQTKGIFIDFVAGGDEQNEVLTELEQIGNSLIAILKSITDFLVSVKKSGNTYPDVILRKFIKYDLILTDYGKTNFELFLKKIDDKKIDDIKEKMGITPSYEDILDVMREQRQFRCESSKTLCSIENKESNDSNDSDLIDAEGKDNDEEVEDYEQSEDYDMQ